MASQPGNPAARGRGGAHPGAPQPLPAWRKSARGQAMLEFAFSLVLLLLLTVGTLDFARALNAYSFVAYAAREATRYAAVRGLDTPAPATAAAVSDFILGETAGLDPQNLVISTTWNPDQNPGSVVAVQVRYTMKLVTPFLPATTLTLSSTSQMVIS